MQIQEVPVPTAPPGGVLVRVTHSVISLGTEKMKVEQAKMNLLQKAKARPDQVRKVIETARNLGWKSALEKVRNRMESPSGLGYSAAGVVVDVHPLNTRFRVGDRVACGGAECAFHAEYIAIPDMLAALVPAEVPNWQAAYTTLASIALHAVRQTQPGLGDKVLVIGQGLVGLLITNLLKISGARVMAVDVVPARRQVCHQMGAERVVILGEQDLREEVRHWTEGYGVDAVVVCTASQTNTPIEQAAEACRDRARIVDVGITKIELPWRTFAEKELDFRFSRSYGPGRYDPSYEWGGNDYPIGYVRWTEQRNFQACLDVMRQGVLNLEALTTRRVNFLDCLEVYNDLTSSSKDIGIVMEYPQTGGLSEGQPAPAAAPDAKPAPKPSAPDRSKPLASPVQTLDMVGAGNFARTMLLPHLKGKVRFGTVVNQTALSAKHVQGKFGFENSGTNHAELFKNGGGGAVVISTRHHLHAPVVLGALAGGSHIFVEKPLCLTGGELEQIDQAYAKSKSTIQIGFNRRFAPATAAVKKLLASAPGPVSLSYRVNAGKLDPSHWFANVEESGGRVLGETCHYFDLFCHLTQGSPVRVTSQTTWPASGRTPFPDSVCAQVEFSDGSCAQLIYSSQGDPSFPKETLTVFAAGFVAETVNFMELTVHKGRGKRKESFSSKGHAEQMVAWLGFLTGSAPHPFPYEQSRVGTVLTFAALRSIQEGRAVELAGFKP